MERFFGLDVHKNYVVAAAVDRQSTQVFADRFNLSDGLARFTKRLQPTDTVVVEASTNVWPVHDLLSAKAGKVLVANPIKTRAIAEARIKTDKVDALTLAKLASAGFVAEVWVPDPETRDLRALASHRQSLSGMATRLKNKIHALLKRAGILNYPDDLFTQKGRQFLATLQLSPAARLELDSSLRLLDATLAELEQTEAHFAHCSAQQKAVYLLMQIPGIKYLSALTILSEIGDVTRFPSAKKLASYAGLVPRISQSGQKLYTGHITKAGRKKLRWILVECAQTAARRDPSLREFFTRIQRKKGHNVAVVALAHKLLVIIWHMLVKGEPYKKADPALVARKLELLAWKLGKEGRQGASCADFVANGLQSLAPQGQLPAEILSRYRQKAHRQKGQALAS